MKTIKSKNIKIEEDLIFQIEALCEVLHTNFSNKTKELLVNWKIEELKRLKDNAPEMYEQYIQAIKKAH
ncbi:hypothetical protein [Rhodoferax sp.]|uniref:hypothetical protein n=1 Tax=Rhodoferax sp. TaxID=50421 RepID=UPI0026283EC6|nr:hypothetical protein [Rhodoferax sp.]MDD2808776.1 hypothetical protein [Rhodoferax sp.]